MNLMTPKLLDIINTALRDKRYYRPYQLKEWKRLRGLALKRDNNECQDCKALGKYSKAEEVHHIVELKENTKKFLELDNVVSLCKDCHNKRHKRFFSGRKKSKKEFTTPERW